MMSKDDLEKAKERAKHKAKEIFGSAPADVEEELKREKY